MCISAVLAGVPGIATPGILAGVFMLARRTIGAQTNLASWFAKHVLSAAVVAVALVIIGSVAVPSALLTVLADFVRSRHTLGPVANRASTSGVFSLCVHVFIIAQIIILSIGNIG